MRRPLIVGNWKMNTTRDEAAALATALAGRALRGTAADIGVAPPFVWLPDVLRIAHGSGLRVYAQNASEHPAGAFTGEIAVAMLKELGCDGVLLGHSERRHVFGESSALVGRKVDRAQAAGLDVILCVGETLEDRRTDNTWAVIREQLDVGLRGATPNGLTIAYEPVWAIGTGETATTAQASDVHTRVRAWLIERFGDDHRGIRIQYGGSVKANNAGELLAAEGIDGLLVGGASLDATSFGGILDAAR